MGFCLETGLDVSTPELCALSSDNLVFLALLLPLFRLHDKAFRSYGSQQPQLPQAAYQLRREWLPWHTQHRMSVGVVGGVARNAGAGRRANQSPTRTQTRIGVLENLWMLLQGQV